MLRMLRIYWGIVCLRGKKKKLFEWIDSEYPTFIRAIVASDVSSWFPVFNIMEKCTESSRERGGAKRAGGAAFSWDFSEIKDRAEYNSFLNSFLFWLSKNHLFVLLMQTWMMYNFCSSSWIWRLLLFSVRGRIQCKWRLWIALIHLHENEVRFWAFKRVISKTI